MLGGGGRRLEFEQFPVYQLLELLVLEFKQKCIQELVEIRGYQNNIFLDLRDEIGLEESNETRPVLLVPRSALLDHAINKEEQHILFDLDVAGELVHDLHGMERVLHLLQHLVPVPLAVQ